MFVRNGKLTRLVERETARVPSIVFMGAAGASIVGSLVAFFRGRKELSTLIGEWVPTFLILGFYNRFVRTTT